uniref:Uncharacterized protein n=1 Tax=Anopheles funestus TaxID=62324 RepID=A0A182S0Z8_ANOFN
MKLFSPVNLIAYSVPLEVNSLYACYDWSRMLSTINNICLRCTKYLQIT